MCYFKDIKKIKNLNEMQMTIAKVILGKKQPFNYQNIFSEIKAKLMAQGVTQSIADSFKIDNMIDDTLKQMIEKGNITFFNNLYVPRKMPIKKWIYIFA